jgi:nicotinamidase-related amidase
MAFPPKPITLRTDLRSITFDRQQTALVVIDVINDFCTKGSGADLNSFDVGPGRAPVAALAL